MQTNEFDKRTQPRKPIFDDDYNFTEEDHQAALFIRESCEDAQVADVAGHLLTVRELKPCVLEGFFYGTVSPYAPTSMNYFQLVAYYMIATFAGN